MNLIEIFSILLIHWFADFVLQTDEQAKMKSKKWKPLLHHVLNYTLCWIPFLYFIVWFLNIKGFNLIGLFLPITFACHTITDYFTSRLNSRLWTQGKTHLFFVSIGFDQILHYIQLFLTYYLLIKYS